MGTRSSLSQIALPVAPVAALETATKSYVDLMQWPHSSDAAMYGDLLSSTQRRACTNYAALSNGYYTLSMVVVPRALTGITKVRFHVAMAATAMSGTPTVNIYHGASLAALPRVATAPAVVNATLTTAGIKELALSGTIALTAGQYLAWMSYIPAGTYMTMPGLACTAVTYAALINAGANYSAYKTAAVAAPSTLDATSGWTADTNVPWWSVL